MIFLLKSVTLGFELLGLFPSSKVTSALKITPLFSYQSLGFISSSEVM
jgi:hypothetical protein